MHAGQATTGDSEERAVEMARSRRRYQELHYSRGGRLAARAAVSVQFALLALAARMRGRAGAAVLAAGGGRVARARRPGLRERAAAFDAERR